MNALTHRIKNRTWNQLSLGNSGCVERRITSRDMFLFAHASGNINPLNIPQMDEIVEGGDVVVVPSMWIGSLISSVLGNIFPGPGTLYKSQDF